MMLLAAAWRVPRSERQHRLEWLPVAAVLVLLCVACTLPWMAATMADRREPSSVRSPVSVSQLGFRGRRQPVFRWPNPRSSPGARASASRRTAVAANLICHLVFSTCAPLLCIFQFCSEAATVQYCTCCATRVKPARLFMRCTTRHRARFSMGFLARAYEDELVQRAFEPSPPSQHNMA